MKDAGPDVIRWVIDCMMQHDRRITPAVADTVEREARAYWGGTSVSYIAKSSAADRANASGGRARHGKAEDRAPRTDPQAVLRDYLQLPADQAAKRHGISRATLYRLIKRV